MVKFSSHDARPDLRFEMTKTQNHSSETNINYNVYILNDAAKVIVFEGRGIELHDKSFDKSSRQLLVKFGVSNVVPAPRLQNIELFDVKQRPSYHFESICITIAGNHLLSTEDFVSFHDGPSRICIVHVMDKQKFGNTFNISSSINCIQFPVHQQMLENRKRSKAIDNMLSSNIIKLQNILEMHLIDQRLYDLFTKKIQKNSRIVQNEGFGQFIKKDLAKLEIVKKFQINGEVKASASLITPAPLHCGENKVGELHGAFLLVKFKDGLNLCIVWAVTNKGIAHLLNVENGCLYGVDLYQSIQKDNVFVA